MIEKLWQKADRQAAEVSLPEPPSLWSRRVFGPSAVFTAMAIGSGELVFWPGLTLSNGAGVLWIAILVVILQYVLNTEIGRYSLTTGESAVVGASRLWNGWSWILLVGAIVPWLWPGWARAGCQLLGAAFELPEKPLSIVSLILCGIILSASSHVYKSLERIQVVLLVAIFLGVLGLSILVVATLGGVQGFWSSFISGSGLTSLAASTIALKGPEFMALIGGVVFAGGGGILNLGYGLLLCEKKFGMGAYSKPILGLRHSLGLRAPEEASIRLAEDTQTTLRWNTWLRLCRREHALLFLGGNVFTIVVIALTFYVLLGSGTGAKGTEFLLLAEEKLGNVGGSFASATFVAVAFAIFFTSEIGILDITARIGAGILHPNLERSRLSPSALYHMLVWFEIVVGILLTSLDPRQPFWFLVTSGVLNLAVMCIYTFLVSSLNRKTLPAFARPGIISMTALLVTALIYGLLFLITFAGLLKG